MTAEKKRFIYSLVFPAFFLFLIWAVKIFEITMELSFVEGGVYPRRIERIKGDPVLTIDSRRLEAPDGQFHAGFFAEPGPFLFLPGYCLQDLASDLLYRRNSALGCGQRSIPYRGIRTDLWTGSLSLSERSDPEGENPDWPSLCWWYSGMEEWCGDCFPSILKSPSKHILPGQYRELSWPSSTGTRDRNPNAPPAG